MSNLRAGPYTLKDKDDDAAFQALKDDVTMLKIALGLGSPIIPADNSSLKVVNNLSDLDNVGNARTSLGLGSLAIASASSYLASANNLSELTSVSTAQTNLGLGNMALQSASAVSISGGAIAGITDLAVADGGTGSSTAAGARTNLGLGSAALNATGDFLQVANNLSDLNNTASARTNLGLGSMAIQSATSVSITGGSITGLTTLTLDGGSSSANGVRFDYSTSSAGKNSNVLHFKRGTQSTGGIDIYSSCFSATVVSLKITINDGTGDADVLTATQGTSTLINAPRNDGSYIWLGNAANQILINSGDGAAGVIAITNALSIYLNSTQIGFFGTATAAKTAVSDPSAIVTTETAGLTYTANEQTMLGHLKTDVTNLRSKLLGLCDALQSYNLV